MSADGVCSSPDEAAKIVLPASRDFIGASLQRDAAIAKDAVKLTDVLKRDQEVLCRQQRKC